MDKKTLYDNKLYLLMRLQFWISGEWEIISIITITPRSTLTGRGSIC